MTNRNVLLVDDDANVLLGYQRQLRQRFGITLARGANEALQTLKDKEFAVVVSDMRMPGMSGSEFLAHVRRVAPKTIRMMLTGNADQKSAVDAVNDGAIFRFLNKPCPPEEIAKSLEAGIEQYRLRAAESELLCKTLGGTVAVLIEVLTLANPVALGRARRVRDLVHETCQLLQLSNAWEVEIAAMLSQIGCVHIPAAILAKGERGEELTGEERQLYLAHPSIGRQIIAKIPRLEGAAEMVGRQAEEPQSAESRGALTSSSTGLEILQAALRFDTLTSAGAPPELAYATMSTEPRYNPEVLGALARALGLGFVVELIGVADMQEGMVLEEHIVTRSGEILLCKGREINAATRASLERYLDIREPIRVRRPTDAPGMVSVQSTRSARGGGEGPK